jgi:nucleoside-diphosphate-sugar epimerase
VTAASAERTWSRQRVIVMTLAAVAILARSAIFLFRDQSYFDADQAVIGLMAKDLSRGRITYPGPLGVEHEWAYLPDFAATLVRLAEQRASFGACETFGFPGHAVTGQEFIATIEAVTKSKFTLRPMSWWMIKTFGQLLAMGRELAELEYLWRVPHRISGDKLKAAIGEVPHTPLPEAIAASLRAIGYKA